MLRSVVLVTESVLMCQLKGLYENVTQKQSYEFLYNPEMRYLRGDSQSDV